MEIAIVDRPVAEIESGAVVAFVFEREQEGAPLRGEGAEMADRACGGWISEIFQTGEINGKLFDTAILPRPTGWKANRLVVTGCGKAARFSSAVLRLACGAAARLLKSKKCRSLALLLDTDMRNEEMAAAAVEGVMLGVWEPDRYKSEKNGDSIDRLIFVAAPGPELERGIARGRIIAESQNFARDLVNEPANRLSPSVLADRAREMAEAEGLEADVLGPHRMKQLGMGALLGVAQGSAEPPALIVLRYRPSEPHPSGAHLGLVGKGVTFDTGGISIKPSEGMERMKYDMAGGAAVLGAIRALARLKPPLPVTALIPAVENMPGSKAQRPGDIVTSLAGKTIEVLNTDAEGRLILVDAIEYAKRQGCTHLVDAATLTGAIVVALGHVNTGVFANDDAFRDRLLDAAKAEGEKMWPMPVDDDYLEQLKSVSADLPNIGNRWGGAVTAAMFLKEFAGSTPWVHLDIAGTAWLEESKPHLAKGPSGVGVRTLTRLAENWR